MIKYINNEFSFTESNDELHEYDTDEYDTDGFELHAPIWVNRNLFFGQ